jgi:hypothetical protein
MVYEINENIPSWTLKYLSFEAYMWNHPINMLKFTIEIFSAGTRWREFILSNL